MRLIPRGRCEGGELLVGNVDISLLLVHINVHEALWLGFNRLARFCVVYGFWELRFVSDLLQLRRHRWRCCSEAAHQISDRLLAVWTLVTHHGVLSKAHDVLLDHCL